MDPACSSWVKCKVLWIKEKGIKLMIFYTPNQHKGGPWSILGKFGIGVLKTHWLAAPCGGAMISTHKIAATTGAYFTGPPQHSTLVCRSTVRGVGHIFSPASDDIYCAGSHRLDGQLASHHLAKLPLSHQESPGVTTSQRPTSQEMAGSPCRGWAGSGGPDGWTGATLHI